MEISHTTHVTPNKHPGNPGFPLSVLTLLRSPGMNLPLDSRCCGGFAVFAQSRCCAWRSQGSKCLSPSKGSNICDCHTQENILISDEGRGLITDFGSSVINTVSASVGAIQKISRRFSAPEIVVDRVRNATSPADIWSFGCLFYSVCSLLQESV